jgi:hypothetical protein
MSNCGRDGRSVFEVIRYLRLSTGRLKSARSGQRFACKCMLSSHLIKMPGGVGWHSHGDPEVQDSQEVQSNKEEEEGTNIERRSGLAEEVERLLAKTLL